MLTSVILLISKLKIKPFTNIFQHVVEALHTVFYYYYYNYYNYLQQGGIIFRTVCLSNYLFVCLQGYANTAASIFLKTNRKMGLGPTYVKLNFESDLDKRNNPPFPIYLLL